MFRSNTEAGRPLNSTSGASKHGGRALARGVSQPEMSVVGPGRVKTPLGMPLPAAQAPMSLRPRWRRIDSPAESRENHDNSEALFHSQGHFQTSRRSPARSVDPPSVRKPPIFQEIRLAIRSSAAKQPIGARWENSRCRRMVKAAAARMAAQRIKPVARVAGIATRIAADISNPPVTRHHHAGYPHRTKLLRVVDVAIALNKPALAKAAASSLMKMRCMAQATANA